MPEIRDPEYGHKIHRLRKLVAHDPNRPLWLLLGSSRADYGLCPDALKPDGSPAPQVFNLGLTGGGPLHQLLALRRVLAEGIRPRRVFLEVMPLQLSQDESWNEWCWLDAKRLGANELAVLARHSSQASPVAVKWLQARLVPCYAHRYLVMSRLAPSWLPWKNRHDDCQALSPTGWRSFHECQWTDEARTRGLAFARDQYAHIWDHFRISPAVDCLWDELLALCREQGISATLLIMPEGPSFRQWYRPESWPMVERYLDALSHEHGAAILNARQWCPEEDFFDGHHLLPEGAKRFTEKFFQAAISSDDRRLAELP